MIENEGPNAFITKDPRESISEGPGKDIPYLMSFVETNGNYMASGKLDLEKIAEKDIKTYQEISF